jgi:hypothetical protein
MDNKYPQYDGNTASRKALNEIEPQLKRIIEKAPEKYNPTKQLVKSLNK